MKLRINDILVTLKPCEEGLEATIWSEFSYRVVFGSLTEFIEQIEDQIKIHTEYELGS